MQHSRELAELLLRKKGITYPEEFEEVTALTPYAAILRYEDDVVQTARPFDRLWVRACVRKVRTWAESALPEEEAD